MIGSLRGRIAVKQPPQLVVDVGGVGYEVEAPMSTFYELPETGAEVTLFTHLVVREDAHTLYGFASESERGLFRQLIKVSGVGARMAVGILSGISVDGFVRCVREGDAQALTRVPGVGKKTAERLVVEMRDRIDAGSPAAAAAGLTSPESREPRDEAYGALIALGYRPAEVDRLLKKVDAEGRTSEEIIRAALQAAAR